MIQRNPNRSLFLDVLITMIFSVIGVYLGLFFNFNEMKIGIISTSKRIEAQKDIVTYKEEISDNISDDVTSDKFFLVEKYFWKNNMRYIGEWEVKNSTSEISSGLEKIKIKYDKMHYPEIVGYNNTLICILNRDNGQEYLFYDIKKAERLQIMELILNPSKLCEDIIAQKKEQINFDENAFREAFNSLSETDANNTSIRVRMDNTGFIMAYKNLTEINITEYIKGEYRYEYDKEPSFCGGFEHWEQNGKQKTCFCYVDETDNGDVLKICMGGDNETEVPYINSKQYSPEDAYVVYGFDKAYLYIKYNNSACTLIYDVYGDTPVLIGNYKDSYFPGAKFINSDKFIMCTKDGYYTWYTLGDNGIPKRLSDVFYDLSV